MTEPRPLTRRQRARREFLHEARTVARRFLAEQGVDGVTMAGVAREVGVAGPGMYQYFDGRAGLLRAIYADVLDELLGYLSASVAGQDPDDLAGQVTAGTRAIFVWCREHRNEFDLLMGASFREAAGRPDAADGVRDSIAQRLGGLWVPTFERIWRSGVEFVPEDELPQPLRQQLVHYRGVLLRDHPDVSDDFPLGAVHALFVGWRQIYGLLCMVAYDQLDFVFGNFDAAFDDLMSSLLTLIGLAPSDRGPA